MSFTTCTCGITCFGTSVLFIPLLCYCLFLCFNYECIYFPHLGLVESSRGSLTAGFVGLSWSSVWAGWLFLYPWSSCTELRHWLLDTLEMFQANRKRGITIIKMKLQNTQVQTGGTVWQRLAVLRASLREKVKRCERCQEKMAWQMCMHEIQKHEVEGY